MNENESNPQCPGYRERGWDRRSRISIEPPPFLTRSGLVTVERRSPFDRHGPDHGQFALGCHTGHLLGVQGQVIAQHPGCLLGSDLGQHGNVVEDAGDIVNQSEQTGSSHWVFRSCCRRRRSAGRPG